MKKYCYILFFLSLLVLSFISCSDWEKDPTSVSKVEPKEEEPSGVLMSTNFPKNLSAFYMGNDTVYLAGTSDGLFYKSTNKGLTWKLTGEMPEKDIIYFFLCLSEDPKFFIAGTKRGGYLSSDYGSSWREVLPASINKGYGELKRGGISINSNKLRLAFTSCYDSIKYFSSIDTGKTWTKTDAVYYGISSTPISDCYEVISGDIVAFNGRTQSAIKKLNGSIGIVMAQYNEDMKFSSVVKSFQDRNFIYSVGSK